MGQDDLVLRYGHSEGLSTVCYDDSGEHVVSCGYDGTVKIWSDVNDDQPTSIKSGERVYSVAIQGENLFVATDNNSVDRYEFPSGSANGILARFTGNVTCLAVSESKKFVAAGSSDFDLKIVNSEGKQKCFLGHQAPVLSVALDPMDEFLASVSCDGTLKIWNLSNQNSVFTVKILKPSNDIGNSESLGKLCWRPATGEDVAVPVQDGIALYSRLTWQVAHTFKCDVTSKAFQCCAFSLCGRFVATGSVDGWIVVWDAETQECVRKEQHPLKSCISSIAWNPKENNSLAISDTRGQMGVLDNVVPTEQPTNKRATEDEDLNALFEEDDDNMMVDLMADEDKVKEDDVTSSKKRQRVLDDSDNESDAGSRQDATQSSDLPPIPSTLDVFANDDLDHLAPPIIPPLPSSRPPGTGIIDDDASSVATGNAAVVPGSSRVQASNMQPPFQPGSTPVHLSHRFMVWNAVGVIRCYDDELENAIDVEFHDAQTHHPLHISNTERFTMADLSSSAAVLASQANDDVASKLKCVHFSSWDNNKDWTVDMPEGEEIQAIATGDCWIAVCTDALQVRLFSLGGTQRQIFSIPGPVVAMAAHTDQLIICYHVTQGFGSNQCLGFTLLELGAGGGCKPRKVVGGQPLPISAGSTLHWLGFSAEGTPATVDNLGVIRMMNRAFCSTWTVVLRTKELTKSRYDHYWVVGLHENPQQVRCILCKGLNYPQTLPRPTLAVLAYKLPLCEMESDKGKYEEEYWRTRLFTSHSDYLTSRGYEEDAEAKRKSQLEMQHSLMRLFALCCKTEQEFKAHEVCSMMPNAASVNLAIKYASRMRKILLAQRLSEVAQEKALEEMEAARLKQSKQMMMLGANQEEQEESGEEEEEQDFRSELQAGYSASETEWARRKSQTTPSVTASQSSRATAPVEEDDVEVMTSRTPAEAVAPETRVKPIRSLSSQLAGSRRNPFKKATTPAAKPSQSALGATPGGSVLDNIKRTTPNAPRRPLNIPDSGGRKSKDSGKKSKSGQTTLFSTKLNLTSTPKAKKAPRAKTTEAMGEAPKMQGDLNDSEDASDKVSAQPNNSGDESDLPVLKEKLATNRTTSAEQLYVDEKLGEIERDNPDLDGVGARKAAMEAFRSLAEDDRNVYVDRAKQARQGATPSGQKRRRESGEENKDDEENEPPTPGESEPPKGKRPRDSAPGDAKSRLSAFAFQSQ